MGILGSDEPPDCDATPTKLECLNKTLMRPEVLVPILVGVGILLVVLCIAIWWLLKMNRKLAPPYSKAIQLVVLGHNKAIDKCNDEAFKLYRAAFDAICGHDMGLKADTENKLSAIAAADEALTNYNASVGLGVYLSLAFSSDVSDPAPTLITVSFQHGLGAEIDAEFRISSIAQGGDAAACDLCLGDCLVAINGEDIGSLSQSALQSQLGSSGSATFQRSAVVLTAEAPVAESQAAGRDPFGGGDDDDVEVPVGDGAVTPPLGGSVNTASVDTVIFVCGRCAARNRAEDAPVSFRCFSCQATALPWKYIVKHASGPQGAGSAGLQTEGSRRSPCLCIGKQQSGVGLNGYLEMQDVSWEETGLHSTVRHQTGFGRAGDPPADCQHHRQVGATCGMAAVNNLITNSGRSAVDAEHMIGIADRLRQAEESLRDEMRTGEGEEAPEEEDPYAAQRGGHFDVQTLQIAFEDAGFRMWYTTPQQQDEAGLFASTAEGKEMAGYVLHRRDALNRLRDHWFVVRRHVDSLGDGAGTAGSKAAPKPKIFLQDSMYEKVFELTEMEARQLLLNAPAGGLFTVQHAVT